MSAKPPADSFTEMVQVVLPNDANPLGFMLGGSVMHLIDIAGAIAAGRHARRPVVTAAVDDLQFLHPIRVGDLIVLRARVNATFTTSMEIEVEVYSEEVLTGLRTLTSRAFLTFVTVAPDGGHAQVAPLLLETDEEKRRALEAHARRAERLRRRKAQG
jgi:acyl-CoA hydrolase